MNRETYEIEKQKAIARLKQACIVLTEQEQADLELTDFGLNNFPSMGLTLLTYVNTSRCCSKELVMLPLQTCPEHRHPPIEGNPGKEETFRCRAGKVYLYIEGEPTPEPVCKAPAGREAYYQVWHEIELKPGQQFTLPPNTRHWFQAGPDGAIVSEFSTSSRDELDVFTDPDVQRMAAIE